MINKRSRFVVVLLITALSSQLVQAQLVSCDQMRAGTTVSTHSTPHSASDEPGPTMGFSTTGADSEHQMPVSSSCIVSAMCAAGPAVPTLSQTAVDALDRSRLIAFAIAAPATRALRPDLPPPRV